MTVDLGRDLSCTTSIKTGRYVTGARLVAEAAYRRLTTKRGTLRGGPEEASYGMDLADLVGSVRTKADVAAIGGRIESELSKDERIASLSVDVLATFEGPAVSCVITVEAVTAAGPFTLKLSVDSVTIELLGIEEED